MKGSSMPKTKPRYGGYTAEEWQEDTDGIIEAIGAGVFDDNLRDIAAKCFDRRDVLRGVISTSKPITKDDINDDPITEATALTEAADQQTATPTLSPPPSTTSSSSPKRKARGKGKTVTRTEALAKSKGMVVKVNQVTTPTAIPQADYTLRFFTWKGKDYRKEDIVNYEVNIRCANDPDIDGLRVLITGVGPKAVKAVFRDLPPVGHKWRNGMDTNHFVFIPKALIEHVLV
jgi:hypothetical protein